MSFPRRRESPSPPSGNGGRAIIFVLTDFRSPFGRCFAVRLFEEDAEGAQAFEAADVGDIFQGHFSV